MGFDSIRKILPSVVRSRGIAPQLLTRKVLEEAAAVLHGLWGEERAVLVQPVSFHEGTLKLASTSAAAMQELRVHQVAILNEINRKLGERIVRSIALASKGF